jgi:hypothetical protein
MRRSRHWSKNLPISAALSVFALLGAAGAAAAQAPATCTGTLSGASVSSLVIPAGASCTVSNVAVVGDVEVRDGATLDAPSTTFSVGGSVTVGAGATFFSTTSSSIDTGGSLIVGGSIRAAAGSRLGVTSKNFEIAGSVTASGSRFVTLAPVPWIGFSAAIGGDVSVNGAGSVAVLDVNIGGSVKILGSGDVRGVEVGFSTVGGSVTVTGSDATNPAGPTVFSIVFNTVARSILFNANDTTGTIRPPLIGGNTVGGNLICAANTPAPTNDEPGGPFPNTISGHGVGQCAGL